MSGGEQQMVALARALMTAPKILLVDEPSVGLAPILVSRVIAKIKELKERSGLTVLMAEQNFNQAIKVADRAYVMVHGRIEFEGKTAELADNPMIKRYYLGLEPRSQIAVREPRQERGAGEVSRSDRDPAATWLRAGPP